MNYFGRLIVFFLLQLIFLSNAFSDTLVISGDKNYAPYLRGFTQKAKLSSWVNELAPCLIKINRSRYHEYSHILTIKLSDVD